MDACETAPLNRSHLPKGKSLWLWAGLALLSCALYPVWLQLRGGTSARGMDAGDSGTSTSAPALPSTGHSILGPASRQRQAAGNHEPNPAAGSPPALELRKIVPFGRTLELIGSVDPGSYLMVGEEVAEVEGDGTFKHFTKQYPGDAGKVDLVLKVTDLAGKVRVVTAAHDFFGGSGKN